MSIIAVLLETSYSAVKSKDMKTSSYSKEQWTADVLQFRNGLPVVQIAVVPYFKLVQQWTQISDL